MSPEFIDDENWLPDYEEFDDDEFDDDEFDDDEFDDDEPEIDFADPGGRSALRAETPDNPRVFPCPTCCTPNVLTRKDVELHYCCDACADAAERGF